MPRAHSAVRTGRRREPEAGDRLIGGGADVAGPDRRRRSIKLPRAAAHARIGDTLVLAPGPYDNPDAPPGLPIFDLHGTAAAPITITGPETGPRPLFVGRATHNTLRIANASHIVVRNLDIDGRNLGGDGVNGQGPSHHITLENLGIRGIGPVQGVVGISTNRAPAWYWTIRGCAIVGAGTGMYLGNSDGRNPFVAGIIERNLVRDTLGYNVQIKHQVAWPELPGLPRGGR